jgi:hypothetical protein
LTFSIIQQNVIHEPWLKMKPIRIGSVPKALGTPDLFFMVIKDKQPLLRVDYYKGDECYCFEEAIIWNDHLAIGIGHCVFLVDIESRKVLQWDLGCYFGSFFPQKDYLLAASAQKIQRINPDGTLRWISNDIGIDGVRIDRIEDDIIHGEGEWDPPGGWKPFRVELDTGKLK